jgi:hypothetical protein
MKRFFQRDAAQAILGIPSQRLSQTGIEEFPFIPLGFVKVSHFSASGVHPAAFTN